MDGPLGRNGHHGGNTHPLALSVGGHPWPYATADLLFRKKPSVEDYQQSRVVAFARIRTDGGGGQNGKHTKNSND
jgi:hypothetical protein